MNRGARQDLISNLYLRIKEINREKENRERNIRIKRINAEATFMHYSNLLNGTEYRKLLSKIASNEERKYDTMEKDAVYRMLAYHNTDLMDLYCDVLAIYEKYDLYYRKVSFNEKELQEAFIMFLEYTGLSEFFESIKNNQMFLYGSNKIKKGEHGLCIPHEDKAYIILGQTRRDYYEYYLDLIYEIAMAYVNKILYSDKLTFEEYKCFYYFIPPTFCQIFFEFLIHNKVFDITKIRLIRANNEFVNYEKIASALDICSLINRKNKKITDIKSYEEMIKKVDKNMSLFIQQETIGIIASYKLLCEYKKNPGEFIQDIGYIVKKMRRLDFCKLLETYCQIGSVKEVVDKNLEYRYVKK